MRQVVGKNLGSVAQSGVIPQLALWATGIAARSAGFFCDFTLLRGLACLGTQMKQRSTSWRSQRHARSPQRQLWVKSRLSN
jgi:hypothetical protein